MAVNVTWLQAGGYVASVDRMGRAALLAKATTGANKARSGILPFNGLELLPAASSPTPNMQTVTSAGVAIIQDAAGGAYTLVNDAPVTLTHAAANGTNARIDLIIARVWDNEAGDAAATTALVLPGTAGSVNVQTVTGTIEIVQGVPAGVPLVPALPSARCIILGQVTVRAATASILASDIAKTGRAPHTVAAGGILPVDTAAELVGLAAAYEGQYFDEADTNLLVRWDGAALVTVADPAAFTAMTAYTPVWNGTIGNGTIVGSFKQVGKMVDWRLRMVLGTTSGGPGTVYTWTLPVAGVVPFGSHTPAGDANFWGGANVDGSAVFVDATHVQAWFTGQAAAAQSGNPGTWAAGAEIVLWGRYEAA